MTAQGGGEQMTDANVTDSSDRLRIREMVEAWVVWRDSGQWELLSTLWHDDAVMAATWQQASAAEFITASRAAWARGVDVQHLLGGTVVDLAGNRAIAQTKMTIGQRGSVHDVIVDVVCIGRFYDFFERRDGRWGIVLRQPTYERDRMDPVDLNATLTLDPTLLASFPEGYRHLAYLQTVAGMQVKRDMPGRMGPETEHLYARGGAWLAGASGHPADPAYGVDGLR